MYEIQTKADFWSRKLVLVVALSALASAFLTLLMPKDYESEVILMLDQGNDESALMSLLHGGDFQSIASLSGLGGRQAGNAYSAIVLSRALLTHLLNKAQISRPQRTFFDYFAPRRGSRERGLEKAVKRLRESIDVEFIPKSGMLRIQVTSKDREISSEIANQLTQELQRFNSEVRRSQTSDAAAFIGARLSEAGMELANAENELAKFKETNARIGNAPRLQLEEKRLERRVQLDEDLYALLNREHESSLIQEKKDSPVFSIIDSAIPATRPHGLHPVMASILAGALGAAAAIILRMVMRSSPARS